MPKWFSFLRTAASNPVLAQEFHDFMVQVQDTANSDLSVGGKRKQYGKLLNGLSEACFTSYLPQILDIVQKRREECVPFKNGEEQVGNILSWLPRLGGKRAELLATIQERRKKYKLIV